MTLPLDEAEEPASGSTRKRSRSANALLARQVSHDAVAPISDTENEKDEEAESAEGVKAGGKSPLGCVPEIGPSTSMENIPPFPNVLHDSCMLDQHTKALRLEANLHPMRLILSRLMAHPTLNRKGVFNTPVDPVALKLPDYFSVIQKPMDLGTVKVRLHAVAYHSRKEVADDIRLVFENAMRYNPPRNTIHILARDLLAFFEDQLEAFAPELVEDKDTKDSLVPIPTAAAVAVQTPGVDDDASGMVSVHKLHAPQATRNNSSVIALTPVNTAVRKRKKRGSLKNAGHACDRCEGRTCKICSQRCLHLEPSLLICNGAHCAGAKIRKGSIYYVAKDGGRQFCQRCHAGLPAVLPSSGHDEIVRYKRDLLKRKNEEEIVERWLSCSDCGSAVHQVCAMHNEYVHPNENYRCPPCSALSAVDKSKDLDLDVQDDETYTFLSGSQIPVKMSEISKSLAGKRDEILTAEALPETAVSKFIQQKVRSRMQSDDCPYAGQTVHVRVISDCNRYFKVPEVVRKHFQMATQAEELRRSVTPPTHVNYRSKAIALFQKIDGLDVCIFCMYVQEYDCDDKYDNPDDRGFAEQKKRVYIAYLDSVEHFRPRPCRTPVYQEMLVSYLASARMRGYENAHIWACPPSRGNSFVFWNHPASQRTPSRDRLVAWYHGALSRAVECGIVTDVKSLYETDFDGLDSSEENTPGKIKCPPLLDGDFWVEEAVRIHHVNTHRFQKAKVEDVATDHHGGLASGSVERCPARLVGSLLRDKIIAHPSSYPFRRPVNAAALKLADYHQIISKPMDLGTVYSRCMLGEYSTLQDLVDDVELTFSNAMKYNPKGHFVHTKAEEVREMFFSELGELVKSWVAEGLLPSDGVDGASWTVGKGLSLSLDMSFSPSNTDDDDHPTPTASENAAPSDSRSDLQVVPLTSGAQNERHEADPPSQDKPASEPTPDLLGGGPEAVQHRMVGDDKWLLDKNPVPPKGSKFVKSGKGRRRKSVVDSDDEPPAKRRKQSWLGMEVAASVRRMRSFFFTCSLVSKPDMTSEEKEKARVFDSYSQEFDASHGPTKPTSSIADARHALLEFSQFRNLEFDSVRRAKYSTAILLYHLHHNRAPGVVPICTCCKTEISEVRWHKISKVVDRSRRMSFGRRGLMPAAPKPAFQPEELCSSCYTKLSEKRQEEFIPLQVSLTSATT